MESNRGERSPLVTYYSSHTHYVIPLTSDKLVKLGNLAGNGQIDALVTNLNEDTTKDIRLDLVGNQKLLAFSKLALLKRVSNLVQSSLVEFLESI